MEPIKNKLISVLKLFKKHHRFSYQRQILITVKFVLIPQPKYQYLSWVRNRSTILQIAVEFEPPKSLPSEWFNDWLKILSTFKKWRPFLNLLRKDFLSKIKTANGSVLNVMRLIAVNKQLMQIRKIGSLKSSITMVHRYIKMHIIPNRLTSTVTYVTLNTAIIWIQPLLIGPIVMVDGLGRSTRNLTVKSLSGSIVVINRDSK